MTTSAEQPELCKCGHPRSDHYSYLLYTVKGEKQQPRCKKCCPHRNLPQGNYATVIGSKFDQFDKAADHEFVASPSSTN